MTPEQQARNILERMGVTDAQTFSSGDVVELANLIAELAALRRVAEAAQAVRRQLEYMMECDACSNEPYESYPYTCGECSYCSAHEDMETFDNALDAARAAGYLPGEGE